MVGRPHTELDKTATFHRTPPPIGGDPSQKLDQCRDTNYPLGGNPWKNFGRRGWDNSTPPLLMACAMGEGTPTTTQGGGLGYDPWGCYHHTPSPPHRPPHPPPQGYPGVGSYYIHPPAPDMGPVRWGSPVGGGYHRKSPPVTGMGALGLSDSTIHAFSAALQGEVATGVVASLTPPLTRRASGESLNPLVPAPPLCMIGVRIRGSESHLGGRCGGEGKRQY